MSPIHKDPATGVVGFFLSATNGQNYVVEATQDFVTWEPISTNLAASAYLDLVDQQATNFTHRFYRSRLLP